MLHRALDSFSRTCTGESSTCCRGYASGDGGRLDFARADAAARRGASSSTTPQLLAQEVASRQPRWLGSTGMQLARRGRNMTSAGLRLGRRRPTRSPARTPPARRGTARRPASRGRRRRRPARAEPPRRSGRPRHHRHCRGGRCDPRGRLHAHPPARFLSPGGRKPAQSISSVPPGSRRRTSALGASAASSSGVPLRSGNVP